MGIKVIKAIKIKEQKDIDLYKDYEDVADLILFDFTSMEKSKSIPKDLISKLPKGENLVQLAQLILKMFKNIVNQV